MFIVVSLVDKWKKVYDAIKARELRGAAMLSSLFKSCVLTPLRC